MNPFTSFSAKLRRALLLVGFVVLGQPSARAEEQLNVWYDWLGSGANGHWECYEWGEYIWIDENNGYYESNIDCFFETSRSWDVYAIQAFNTTAGCAIIFTITYDNGTQSFHPAMGNGGTVSLYYWRETYPGTEPYITNATAVQSCDCPDVASVEARDHHHPGRVAGDGGTLYLVDENAADISATSTGAPFGQTCLTWSTGQTAASFTDTSPSNLTYTAKGHSVSVVRKQKAIVNFSVGQFGTNPINLDQYLAWADMRGRITFNVGGSTYKGEDVEKFNDPNLGVKRTYSTGIGFTASITKDLPKPYSFDFFGYGGYAIYFGMNGSGQFSGAMLKDPSLADSSWQGGIVGTGSLGFVAGARAYNEGGYRATASGEATTTAYFDIRNDPDTTASNPAIQIRGRWAPLTFQYTIRVVNASNEAQVYLNKSGQFLAFDEVLSDWHTVLAL